MKQVKLTKDRPTKNDKMLFARDLAKRRTPKAENGWLKKKKSEPIYKIEIDQKTWKTDNVTERERRGGWIKSLELTYTH